MVFTGETVALSNGLKMPLIGLGTWQSKPGEVEKAVEVAIDAGYRLIDTAQVYGNEAEIGAALKRKIAEGKVKREDLFITTKVWVTHFLREDVSVVMKNSLEKLGVDYVDLFLLHAPCPMERAPEGGFKMKEGGGPIPLNIDHAETWKGMEDVYNAGLTRAIGLSNFNEEQVQHVYDTATVKPHNHQVELHLYFPQFEMVELCHKLGITITSYATLGSPGRLQFQPPKGRKQIEWPDPGRPLDDAIIKKLAEKYKKTPAQVLLRWAMERQIAVIPKSVTPHRVQENFQVSDFKLTAEEVNRLNTEPKIRQRFFLQDWAKGHPQDPFKNERK